MDTEQKKALLAAVTALEARGPAAGRPLVGTLRNGRHPNMKELRYDAHGKTQVWRAVFAFDPQRNAIVLVAGEKQGGAEEQFYRDLLRKANKRFDSHLGNFASDQEQRNGEKTERPDGRALGRGSPRRPAAGPPAHPRHGRRGTS
ncbi:addiction module toxin RelE [Ramlibacter henchirensis]|uniref:Addiction module toxin RelE n=1 Tax=Ramlibacter henchirensis TaxID=204072 RepID=A0A4Z0BM04_9BURK|nr:addiction module toxin RelE [Ramlibacter henchirensis]